MVKSRRVRWVEHVAYIEWMRNAYKILVGKPEGNRPLRRLRHRWKNNIRTELMEIGWKAVDWMHLA
jgi:hypothetical protein